MSFSTRVYVGSVVAALAVGAFAGSVAFSRPSETVFKDREIIKWREKQSASVAVALSKTEGPKTKIMWHEKTVTVPGGTVYVDRWHVKTVDGPVVTKLEEQTVLIREVEVDKIREIIKIEKQTARWTLGAVAGIDTSLRTQAGLTGAVRILGPLHAQIVVTSPTDGIRPVILGGLAVHW